MPLYEYECLNCGKRTEILQRFDDAPLAACPKCGGEVKKLLSAPAVQFKGSGWYVTDYAGKKGGGSSATKSESTGDDSGKSEKTDKPKEAAAESKSSGASSSSGSSGSSGSSE
jgi:putative FmdB family regulatory protein